LSCKTLGGDVGSSGSNANIHAQPICDGDNGVEAVVFRAWTDEVDGDGIPMFVEDWQGVQWASRLGGAAFVSLAFRT
jgi:hypothetical protein